MMRRGNIKMAVEAIKAAKWRSILTSLGIIIGVVSVVTTVSLGEGVKHQIRGQIEQRGQDVITILPGQQINRDSKGKISGFNPLSTGIFSETDYKTVETLEGVGQAAPFAQVTGVAKTEDRSFGGPVIATTQDLPELLRQKVEYGSFFANEGVNNDFAVIGPRVAEELFGEIIPVGKSFTVRGQNFVVGGVFEAFDAGTPLPFGEDYNGTIFIPYETGRQLVGGNIQIQRILLRPNADADLDEAIRRIDAALLASHGGERDFAVLRAEETLALTGNVLNLITGFIAAVAGISLLVGGIGVMNIMLVAVTERTAEIGVRKAVGATTHQIMSQFLTESMILSLFGGVVGVFLSLLVNVVLRITTDIKPVITLPIMGIAIAVSLVVGIIFGVTPALRAARKDPIEALRYE